MYSQYWSLTDVPFQNAINPQWYHETPGHEEAVARLMFVAEQHRRCGLLIGPTGTGKSLVLAVVERQLRRSQRRVANVDLTGRTAEDVLWELASGLRLSPPARVSPADLWRSVSDHLQTSAIAKLPITILLDHPEQTAIETLSAVRRLLNAPAQTGLSVLIAVNTAERSIAGRLSGWADLRVELAPLDRHQTSRYVASRLGRSGATRPLFTEDALDALFDHSNGIPREINRLGELALVAASAFGDDQVDETVVHTVARELESLCQTEDSFAWSPR